MQHHRHTVAYLALVFSGAIFAGAAAARLKHAPLVATLLLAQAAAVAAVLWIIRDAQRRQEDVAALRHDLGRLRVEMASIDEHTEMVASRTERLARILEVRKAVQPGGPDPEETGEILMFPSGPRRIS